MSVSGPVCHFSSQKSSFFLCVRVGGDNAGAAPQDEEPELSWAWKERPGQTPRPGQRPRQRPRPGQRPRQRPRTRQQERRRKRLIQGGQEHGLSLWRQNEELQRTWSGSVWGNTSASLTMIPVMILTQDIIRNIYHQNHFFFSNL